jgi:excisionase family DNA binding protein
MQTKDQRAAAPISHRIDRVVEITGASRTKVYEALRAGTLEAVKFGRATLVLDDSMRRWLATMPRYKA